MVTVTDFADQISRQLIQAPGIRDGGLCAALVVNVAPSVEAGGTTGKQRLSLKATKKPVKISDTARMSGKLMATMIQGAVRPEMPSRLLVVHQGVWMGATSRTPGLLLYVPGCSIL